MNIALTLTKSCSMKFQKYETYINQKYHWHATSSMERSCYWLWYKAKSDGDG